MSTMDIDKTVDSLMQTGDNVGMTDGAVSTVEETPAPSIVEPPTASVEELVPDKDELITMSVEQLTMLKDRIMAETAQALAGDVDFMAKLRLQLERESALRTVENQGQFQDPALKIIQEGPLGPVDHQEAAIAPYKTDKSMNYRVINHRDETLRALRDYQGWKAVRDADGNVVRFMDGTLAEMKKTRFDETIGARVRANRILRGSLGENEAENFKEKAAQEGLKTFGDGLKVDIDSPEAAVKE